MKYLNNMAAMAKYLFEFMRYGKRQDVVVEGYNLNHALQRFAQQYHDVQELYSVKQIPD